MSYSVCRDRILVLALVQTNSLEALEDPVIMSWSGPTGIEVPDSSLVIIDH
jgi:hypothetical protein